MKTAGADVRPIFRWVGGKQFLLSSLLRFVPSDHEKRRYIEPFLGAGSVFLQLQPKRAILADKNRHLIGTYLCIRENPAAVFQSLSKLAANDSEEFYYRTRNEYNSGRASSLQSARFVYLNRTCYNGVFRVNTRGQFNVPYGFRPTPKFPSLADLTSFAAVLARASMATADYQDTVSEARKGDFVYLDPPYPPLNGTSYFAHYTMDRFGDDQQEKLADAVARLDARGCLVMMSNADIPRVRQLYDGFQMVSLPAVRWVTCKKRRHTVQELVITNY